MRIYMESYSAEWSYMIKKPSTQAYKPQEVAKSASCAPCGRMSITPTGILHLSQTLEVYLYICMSSRFFEKQT